MIQELTGQKQSQFSHSTTVQSSSCPTPIPLNVIPCKLDVTPNDVLLCDNNMTISQYVPHISLKAALVLALR
jgi:hypothetical protein